MAALSSWTAALAAAMVVASVCTSSVSGQSELGCIANYDPNKDYFGYLTGNVTGQPFVLPINQTIVDTANDFVVSYGKSYKVARNSLRKTNYVLYQCGSPPPNSLQLGLEQGTQNFQIPITNFSIDSTLPVAFLELLGAFRGLKSVAVDGNYVSSSCLLKYQAQGLVTSINGSVSSVTDKYTLYFISPPLSGPPDNRTNVVLFDATLDPGPLKRAEWIKYLATFLNLEERANRVYESIRNTYQCFNGSQSNAVKKPNLAWLDYSTFSGSPIWTISNATYKIQFGADAGGVNPTYTKRSFNMSVPSDVDAFHKILSELDVVLDESYAQSPPDYKFAKFCSNANISINDSTFPFVASHNVWRNDKRIGKSLGLDWFEGGVAQPQVVLHDLLGILHPALNYGKPYFFRNIALDEGVIMTADEDCPRLIDDALDPAVYPCPVTASQGAGATTLPDSISLVLASMLAVGAFFLV